MNNEDEEVKKENIEEPKKDCSKESSDTDALAAAFKEGAESAGKNVQEFRVADMKIGGCTGCDFCIDKSLLQQKMTH